MDYASGTGKGGLPQPPVQEAVRITAAGVALDGELAMPPPATGIVLFAHGTGSSRLSPRNRRVAEDLWCAGHLIEEPGALVQVSRLATDWFVSHLPRMPADPSRR